MSGESLENDFHFESADSVRIAVTEHAGALRLIGMGREEIIESVLSFQRWRQTRGQSSGGMSEVPNQAGTTS